MKAQLISDVHSEFYADAMGFLRSLEFAPGLDFLLVPGDVVVPASQGRAKTEAAFSFLSLQARHVIYVVGNHEYYNATREQVEGTLGAYMPPNFHWLLQRNADQKNSFSENCKMRGVDAVDVISPKVGDPTELFGLDRSARLNKLKNSARNVSLPCSPRKCSGKLR